MAQSGPIYDNAMKAMCAAVPDALCRWLGVEVDGEVSSVRLAETVPALAARQVDALVAIGDALLLHIEFQSHGESAYGLRMLDYRLRLYRRTEMVGRELSQHVVMLGPGRVDEGIHDRQLDYGYRVHYLAEQPVEPLLADPALAPLAPLAHVADRDRPLVLRRALDLIAALADDHLRTVLAYAAIDLAGLRLGRDIIDTTWEDTAMPIPSLLKRTFEEGREVGREKGRREGREEGREAGRQEMVTGMLRHRFGSDPRLQKIARRLASLDLDVYLDRLDKAESLDDLAGD
jgi:predicted transposase YdaD